MYAGFDANVDCSGVEQIGDHVLFMLYDVWCMMYDARRMMYNDDGDDDVWCMLMVVYEV